MEIFYEQYLTKDYEFVRKKVESTKNALLALTCLNFVFLGFTVALITLVIYFIVSLIARRKFVEFEYELTGNELVVSKIVNKKSRRIMANIKIDEVIKIKSVDSVNNEDIKIVDLTLDDIPNKGLKEKILVVSGENDILTGYKVAMDKILHDLCKKINPSVFRQRLDILKEE